MFTHCNSMYSLKKALRHQMNMIGHPLTGWDWNDEVSHHARHRNLNAVDTLNEALNRKAEIMAQKKPD